MRLRAANGILQATCDHLHNHEEIHAKFVNLLARFMKILSNLPILLADFAQILSAGQFISQVHTFSDHGRAFLVSLRDS